ncbi:MAG: TMEM43 family protein [Rhodanobacteraceae bacterium]
MKSVASRMRSRRGTLIAGILVTLIVLGAVWWFSPHHTHAPAPAGSANGTTEHAAMAVSVDHVDPANEGRLVSIRGPLAAAEPAIDHELGVSADALFLLRHVEMLQWREHCAGGSCTYAKVWSGQPIDSHAFRDAAGHSNPAKMPFRQARFQAGNLHLGAFAVSAPPMLPGMRRVAYPVTTAQLPPNLAASFHDQNGALYAGNDPAHAKVGDLRVSYRIVPLGALEMTGIQQGGRLLLRSATEL